LLLCIASNSSLNIITSKLKWDHVLWNFIYVVKKFIQGPLTFESFGCRMQNDGIKWELVFWNVQ
jgi:hypothetical protein